MKKILASKEYIDTTAKVIDVKLSEDILMIKQITLPTVD